MDERYKHTHLFFKEDGHSYTDSNGNSYLSCTTFVHKYAQEFIEKSLDVVEDGYKVAMFLKIQFLEGKSRKRLFERYS